jgi:hypothetical protein
MYAEASGMGGGGMPYDSKSISPNIQPGNQDITEQMSVVFEVK